VTLKSSWETKAYCILHSVLNLWFFESDLEQKGIYEVVDDKTSHCVSPLWCAAVCGRLNIVKCLVKHGANVNSVSDTGSTPVRSACFMTHFDIVQYLVEHTGADIGISNYNGKTMPLIELGIVVYSFGL